MTKINSPLDGICQIIHATLLSPPIQFLLVSNVIKDEWKISLFTQLYDNSITWSNHESIKLNPIGAKEEDIAQAIKEGLLHVDCGTKTQVSISNINQIHVHFLIKPEPKIISLKSVEIVNNVMGLLNATYQLLNRPQPKVNGNSEADIRELKLQLSQKDSEIATLNSKLSSLKATVVRATASDVNRKKVQQSPQKVRPLPGASQLQPNQKRRKVVEDEFAGSSSDDED
ncbi:uncharacterized protein I206_101477 [Kwoniella pini CBS 10737]|uniref:Uncharacterized protein n=1 Tax=Kwoniella pini CBS 10737 TaxID=1296096 RepID=A0A1B9HWJ4_9TREE|nr:uncharacterized protein I206_06550 [Kwoniella pini CBS 10737]OCF47646.1 hypothetical protein I206_06550 [Kwoniella pini CBS 10737]